MKSLGRHLLAEFYDCEPEMINNCGLVEKFMKDAAEKSGATIIKSVFHSFQPHGVSGVVVIAESHLAIHTWPEYGYAAVDLFTCGDTVDPWVAYRYLKEKFKAKEADVKDLRRGYLENIITEIREGQKKVANFGYDYSQEYSTEKRGVVL